MKRARQHSMILAALKRAATIIVKISEKYHRIEEPQAQHTRIKRGVSYDTYITYYADVHTIQHSSRVCMIW